MKNWHVELDVWRNSIIDESQSQSMRSQYKEKIALPPQSHRVFALIQFYNM